MLPTHLTKGCVKVDCLFENWMIIHMIKERISDLEDISNRVLHILSGKTHLYVFNVVCLYERSRQKQSRV